MSLPLRISTSSILRWGNRRGDSPFCWRSRNQQVPCESLVVKRSLTFLLQRKYPRGAGAGSHPAKWTSLLKLEFRVEYISVLLPCNSKIHQTFGFVGSCRPHWHWLFFYEKSQQKRIQEEVSSWISPQGQSNLQKSFEEWNFSSILGGNDIKLCFYRI